ncbi:hypothetical protein [Saccharopolyspora phatthalungensis]|uniref:Uncharacterized protein n=1 Tax=Saccharopolyspora phatthalungensis TaxID=664693 RepID=A0A840PUY0_9PSEU|nr:hypothetical protein [Saccharopolyspora phatthalungensis]MBB5154092.1 hypothetical protein [Saccharopolyspora phatthalungensis]
MVRHAPPSLLRRRCFFASRYDREKGDAQTVPADHVASSRDDQHKVTGPPIPTPVDIDPVATAVGHDIDEKPETDNDG